MSKYRVNRSYVLVRVAILPVLFAGVLTPQFAQEPAANTQPSEEEQHRRAILMGLMRTINTAEVVELTTHGSYSSWEILLSHKQDYFNGWLTRIHSRDGSARFADAPEVLMGYVLRLNVHIDGRGYDVRLEDTVGKQRHAAFSHESGLIWKAEPLL